MFAYGRSVVAVAAIATGLVFPAPALANTIVVTTTADTMVTDGDCSIREAIINANNDAAPAGFVSVGGGPVVGPKQ
jgi:CSLREA domain-containing protein